MLINKDRSLVLIIIFSLINSSIFVAFSPSGVIRLVISVLMISSALLLVINLFKTDLLKLDCHPYFKILLFLLIIWGSITLLRGFTFDIVSLISLFGHYLMGWVWLTPLAFIFGSRVSTWGVIPKLLKILLLFGVCVSFTFLPFMTPKLSTGFLECLILFPMLFLLFKYQSLTSKGLILLAIFTFLLLSYFASQRINMLFVMLFIIFFIIEFLRGGNNWASLTGYILFSLLFIFFIYFIYNIDYVLAQLMSNDELVHDTRSFLFIELFQDMSFSDLIFGRGALGTYYSPYFYYINSLGVEGGDWYHRQVNEIGYLQMILKGGWLMVVLQVSILLPASYMGIFKSQNVIARMCGYYILTYLLLWFISYYPVYSAENILLWIAVGAAISPSMRAKNNNELPLNC